MATTPPASDPQATQADTVIVGSVNQAVLQQANPTVARAYTSDFVAEKNEIIATQVKQLEATQGFPVTDAQRTGITVFADAPARFIVNSKYQDEIEAANAAQSVPEGTPPPTVAPADINAPPPAAEFGGGKRFEPESVVEIGPPPSDANTDVTPRPAAVTPTAANTGFDDYYGEQTYTTRGSGTADAVPPGNTGFDDYYGEQTYTANRTGTADAVPVVPTPANTGFDDYYGEQTYTAIGTGTADAVPPANTGFDDFYGEQTYTANFTGTADARPVTPAANSQVPQAPIQNIFDLIANLFSRTPAVAPAVNPQVAQAIPVSTPAAIVAVPIPPTANPQVTQVFTVPAPTVTTATPIPPAANPQVAQAIPVPTPTTTSAVPILPVTDAQVPNPATRVVAVSTETLLQNDPDTAREYTTFKNETAEQLTTQRIAEREAVEGGPISVSEQVQIAARAEIDATADANFRYQDQIEAVGAGTTVPADTPPPTPTPAAVANNPQVVVPPTRVVAVSTETLLQNDPVTAQEYTAFKTETAEQLTAQRIAEREAVEGGPISVSEQVQIATRAEIDATADANFRYQDQIEAAGAATVVPADTLPPTVGAASVSPETDSQVPAATDAIVNVGGKRLDPEVVDSPAEPAVQAQSDTRIDGPVDQAALQQSNPTAANDYKSYVVDTQNKIVEQQTRELEASQGFPASENQIAVINGAAFGTATVAADIKFKDQIQAADAAPSVPTGTPPPTETAPAIDSATNPQVPAAQDLGSEPPIDLPQAPPSTVDPQIPSAQDLGSEPPIDLPQAPPAVSAATNPQVPAAQDLGSEPPIDLPQAPPSTVDPQIPQPDSFPEEGIDVPVAPAAGVDPQIPQPDSFPEEGIDLPAPVQSPTPYERFIEQENAGVDAAQAAATARFNAQFDDGGNIIGSSDDPQVNQGDVTDVGEFQAEPVDIPNIDTGYDDFYGNDEINDVGEFQADPPAIPNIDTGYEDFYGNDEVNDVGEFQTEAKSLDNDNSGYNDFYGSEADVGEFQSQPSNGDGESSSFSNFFDDGGGGGGDFLGGLFGGGKSSPGAVSGGSDPFAGIIDGLFTDGPTKPNPKTVISPEQEAANKAEAAKEQARQQNIINQQRKQANDGDWRVRLRLAASSNYLYNAPNPGILAPLSSSSGTSGVIFPYTPQITTAYQAKYNAYELTHSNYKGYFYQGSSVGDISINATFTAQDTQEANYLLAVIHFFRSVTKMFYGKDDSALRGAPPPLVFLQGLGEYQFNLHPCVVSNFNYTLPADVDYIRALSPNNDGTNLIDRRSLQSGVTPFVNPSVSRLRNAGLPLGGISTPPAPPTLGTNSPTYVPTKMDIQLTLLAIQTRSQVSKQFSLNGFANGDLIKGGFW